MNKTLSNKERFPPPKKKTNTDNKESKKSRPPVVLFGWKTVFRLLDNANHLFVRRRKTVYRKYFTSPKKTVPNLPEMCSFL